MDSNLKYEAKTHDKVLLPNKVILGIILVTALSFYTSFQNFLLFHTFIELVSIVIAFCILIIAINTYDTVKNHFFMFLGIAYGFIAVFDLLHTLAYQGMGVFQGNTSNLATQLWIIPRYIESISLVLAGVFINKPLKPYKTALSYSVISAGLLISVFYLEIFPDCFIPGEGLTPFKIISEYIISFFMIIAIKILYKNKKYISNYVFKLMIASYVTTILAELSFTFYIDVYGFSNVLGHIFRLYSYYFIYKALVESSLKNPYNTLFFNLNKTKNSLNKRTFELESLNKDLKKLSAAVEHSPSSVVITDLEGKIEYVNPKFTQITGYSKSEAIGKNPRILRSENSTEELYNDLWNTILNGKEWKGELCNKKKDGSIYWENASISPVLNSEGRITNYIKVAEDITERKRIDENLKFEREQLISIFNSINQIIYISDPNTYEILFVNKTLKNILGKDPTGSLCYKEIYEHDKPCSFCNNNILLSQKDTPIQREHYNPYVNGYYLIVDRIIKWPDGRNVRFEIAVDITELKNAEKECEKARIEAEKANNSKSEFLAKMSHEIRTPLNGILGMTDLVLSSDVYHKDRKYLEMIKSSANSLLYIINDILDFSKVEAGKMELENKEFDLVEAVNECVDSLAFLAHTKGLEIIHTIEDDVEINLIGDFLRLQQIIKNLISNAVKFTDSGEILINVKKSEQMKNKTKLLFSVKDTGIGIDEKDMQNLFSSFSQINNTKNINESGTGLGLAISKQLVNLMDGEIWVESTLNKGSTFYFTAAFEINKNSQNKGKVKFPNAKALIITKNHSIKSSLVKTLSNREIKTKEMDSLTEYVEKPSIGEFDLIFINMTFAEVKDYKVLEKLNIKERKEKVVLLINSHIIKEDTEKASKYGIIDYLIKPVKEKELDNCLKNKLDSKVIIDDSNNDNNLVNIKNNKGTTSINKEKEYSNKEINILVVEDNPVNMELLKALLDKKGWVTTFSTNGQEAIEILKENSFDIILMDVQMPIMNGIETTQIIKENGYSDAPVIALTAYAMKGDREKFMDAGMDNYISKPIQPERLYKTILDSINNKSYKSENEEPVDINLLIQTMGDSKKLLKKVYEKFLSLYPEQIDKIEKAIQTKDQELLESAAHTFKGSVSIFRNKKADEYAKELEKLGNNQDFDRAKDILWKLKNTVNEIINYFDTSFTF